MPAFSDWEIQQLFKAIDTGTPEGYRDYAIILTLLDSSISVPELCRLGLDNVWLEDGMFEVLGKGNEERLTPVGREVQRCLWRYTSRHRPERATANPDFLFLTRDGRPRPKIWWRRLSLAVAGALH